MCYKQVCVSFQLLWAALLDPMVRVCSVLKTVFQSVYIILYPTSREWAVPVSSQPHQHLVMLVNVLDFGHSIRYVVVSHYFSLHFPNDICCGASFHMLIFILCIFDEVAIKSFAYFFKSSFCFPFVKFQKVFVHFGWCFFFVNYIFCKYFLTLYDLSCYSLDSIFHSL